MKFQMLTELSQISRIRDSWNRVLPMQPFQSWEWYHAWYQHLLADNDPRVVIGKDSTEAVSLVAPMYATHSTLGASRLCLAADDRVCTDYSRLIVRDEDISSHTAAFVEWLSSQGDSFDSVEFDGLARNQPSSRILADAISTAGFEPTYEPLESCWVVSLPVTWDELNDSFSSKHRRKTRKAVARLEDAAVLDSQNTDFESLWSNFVELHQARRVSVGDAGCFADQNFHDFLYDAASTLNRRGMAEVLVIERAGQSIAAMLLFTDQTTTYMYQSGFDPDSSSLEPGYMMAVAAIQWSITCGKRRFDFMRGDEPYKARWKAEPEAMARMQFRLNDNLRLMLEDQLEKSKSLVKSSLQKIGLYSG